LETFADLLTAAASFRDRRNWKQFHSVKNLAAAIAVEAGELQEILIWTSAVDEHETVTRERHRIEEELADILIHCANLALAADIDIPEALAAKFAVNEEKYPADRARGSATKYTDLYSPVRSGADPGAGV
jgi:dCTP diphosphatase